MANFGFSEITPNACEILASHDIYPDMSGTQKSVNFPDDTHVVKIKGDYLSQFGVMKDDYIYLIRKTSVFIKKEKMVNGSTYSVLGFIHEKVVHDVLRQMLLAVPPYVERPLI